MQRPKKKVRLQLVGLDGNAFSLMAAFSRQARMEGWTKEEIGQVLNEAKSNDYDHLLATLADACEPPASDPDQEDEDSNQDEEDEDGSN